MEKKKLVCSIHLIKPGVDKGEIVYKNKISISEKLLPIQKQKIYESNNKLFFMGKLDKLFKMNFKSKKQSEKISIYWPRLKTSLHGWIDL